MRLSSKIFAAALALSVTAHGQEAPTPRAYRDYAVRRDGDVDRGRQHFFAQEKTACAACHSVDGTSSKAGPDLFAIGDKFPRRELITAILEPSATIAVGYGATVVETKSGEAFYGVIKRANDEGTELMGADGKLVRVAARDITAQRSSPISLMPEGERSHAMVRLPLVITRKLTGTLILYRKAWCKTSAVNGTVPSLHSTIIQGRCC